VFNDAHLKKKKKKSWVFRGNKDEKVQERVMLLLVWELEPHLLLEMDERGFCSHFVGLIKEPLWVFNFFNW